MDRRWLVFCICLLLCVGVYAQDNTTTSEGGLDEGFPYDPILKYRPAFALSLPIQILMTGIILTLTSVLLIHLIFTAQYHWPLAPVNYSLQISAVFTLLVSQVATLKVILETSTKESTQWPYMLNYVAVDIPPLTHNSDWSTGELAAWLLMNATTSALIQITHIQFLTLLFPSRLEKRLILGMLGPLAVVAAVMQLLPISDHNLDSSSKLSSISAAVQNVCNATLSLLFTAALFIWGLFVNRKQAWRTDGGTAAFGASALLLAIASTAITFVYIPRKEHYCWMPGLMWAVILWQSFLGWWWWVGSGMGVGEVDELLRREEKRRRKRKEKAKKRRLRQERAQTFWKGVAGALGYDKSRGRRDGTGSTTEGEHPDHALSGSDVGHHSSGDEGGIQVVPRHRPRKTHTNSDPTSRSVTGTTTATATSVTASGFFGRMMNHAAGRYVYGWYQLLRHAHLTAAREQAVEHGERIQQVYGREGTEVRDGELNPGSVGWGLGSYGLRQMRENEEREAGWRGIVEEDREEKGSDGDSEEGGKPVEPRVTGNTIYGAGKTRRRDNRRQRTVGPKDEGPWVSESEVEEPSSSMWWWGPLRRWRLQDSTTYS